MFRTTKITITFYRHGWFDIEFENANYYQRLKNLENKFDFSNVDENHELFSNKNKKLIGIINIETPKKIVIDDFVAFRSKMYAYKCGENGEI